MQTKMRSVLRDGLAFKGRSGRREFLFKLLFWQVAVPAAIFGILAHPFVSTQIPDAFPMILLLTGNLAFLLPVATRRARDAGFPAWAFLACFMLVVLSFVLEGRPWAYYAGLVMLASAPSRRRTRLSVSRGNADFSGRNSMNPIPSHR